MLKRFFCGMFILGSVFSCGEVMGGNHIKKLLKQLSENVSKIATVTSDADLMALETVVKEHIEKVQSKINETKEKNINIINVLRENLKKFVDDEKFLSSSDSDLNDEVLKENPPIDPPIDFYSDDQFLKDTCIENLYGMEKGAVQEIKDSLFLNFEKKYPILAKRYFKGNVITKDLQNNFIFLSHKLDANKVVLKVLRKETRGYVGNMMCKSAQDYFFFFIHHLSEEQKEEIIFSKITNNKEKENLKNTLGDFKKKELPDSVVITKDSFEDEFKEQVGMRKCIFEKMWEILMEDGLDAYRMYCRNIVKGNNCDEFIKERIFNKFVCIFQFEHFYRLPKDKRYPLQAFGHRYCSRPSLKNDGLEKLLKKFKEKKESIKSIKEMDEKEKELCDLIVSAREKRKDERKKRHGNEDFVVKEEHISEDEQQLIKKNETRDSEELYN